MKSPAMIPVSPHERSLNRGRCRRSRRRVRPPRSRRRLSSRPSRALTLVVRLSGSAIVEVITEAGTSLTDVSDDEDVPGRPQRRRLRRGDETSHWHPPLPEPPARHPVYNHKNHYDPTVPWDYSAEADISCLLDVQGDQPHRCFLVQWKGRPLQMTWVWEGQLDNATTRPMMQDVLTWKASGTSESIISYHKERDTASAAGTCFMDAFRSALYYLGQPNLVTMEMWDAFEDTRPPEIQNGVTREDITAFFKLLQRQSGPLDYDRLMVNLHSSSSANIETLHDVCKTLDAGAYLVSAGEDGIGHCFVVISHGPGKRLIALDSFDSKRDPPMVVIPLHYQQWIKHVKWICCIALKPGYQCRHGKRKSKTQRKGEKRLEEQQQQ
ncbi:hypothetical protein PF005_g20065 [Phytophthora fragariae]|uniref:Uncharacterized protein n=1 Tax=Phytophthora fragariae TaxID=53985 RepID=A0A6A3WS44_9STRA|nr:hypothetical protein PF005_g20065 [Phytophthora fragariae]